MKWYKLPDDLPDEPFLRKVKIGGKSICLANYKGYLYAFSGYCPHAGADLSGGWCREGKIICPNHRYSYDLHTGKGSPGQNDYVDVFPVEKRDDGIYIGITGFWEKIKAGFK
jgi:nitrite reductase/ring-hydroxylating ferredoxin subunit